MLITKNQLAGLAMMAGLTLAAATACQKENVKPSKVETRSESLVDSSGSGERKKYPAGNSQLRILDGGADDSGEEEKPKLPPH